MVVRFDGRNPRAEQFLSARSSRLITEITETSRNEIRSILTRVMREGVDANRAALDIVGRIAKTGADAGKRVGGVIGLTSRDIRASETAFAELRSGDPKQMQKYLNRKLRNRNLDAAVRKAIEAGKPVPVEEASKIVNAYRQRLLYRRGQTIARTELMTSLHNAQDEGMLQLYDKGEVLPEEVINVWDAADDGFERDTHAEASGQSRRGKDPFIVGGYQMRFPGDDAFGAPAEEIINCRCRRRISFDFAARAQRLAS